MEQQELERLYEKHGGKLTAEIVVREARKKTSPLHEHFEWNDGKAATEYRLVQARQLILRVTIKPAQDERSIHAFVSVPRRGEAREYHTREAVAQSVDMFMSALEAVKSNLRAAQNRFEDVKALAPQRIAKRDLDSVAKKITTARRSAERIKG